MSAHWEISHWPQPSFHAFLSHCQEDRNELVLPVYEALKRERILPWIDVHQYPVGKDPFDALRVNLLICRHVVYFVTPNYLRQGRGWCAAERAYAELIARHFVCTSTSLWDFQLPLLFLGSRNKTFPRSIWQNIAFHGVHCPYPRTARSDCVRWAVIQIKRLIQQQYAQSSQVQSRINNDQKLQAYLGTLPGLKERLLTQSPQHII